MYCVRYVGIMSRREPSWAQKCDEIESWVAKGTDHLVRKSLYMMKDQLYDMEPVTHATMSVGLEAALLLNKRASCVKLEHCDVKYVKPGQDVYLPELGILGRVHSVDDKNDSDGIGNVMSSLRSFWLILCIFGSNVEPKCYMCFCVYLAMVVGRIPKSPQTC